MKKPAKITRFEIMCSQHLTKKPLWYFHLRSRNGKISLPSEMYPTKAHCHRAIVRLIKVISAAPPIVVIEYRQPSVRRCRLIGRWP